MNLLRKIKTERDQIGHALILSLEDVIRELDYLDVNDPNLSDLKSFAVKLAKYFWK